MFGSEHSTGLSIPIWPLPTSWWLINGETMAGLSIPLLRSTLMCPNSCLLINLLWTSSSCIAKSWVLSKCLPGAWISNKFCWFGSRWWICMNPSFINEPCRRLWWTSGLGFNSVYICCWLFGELVFMEFWDGDIGMGYLLSWLVATIMVWWRCGFCVCACDRFWNSCWVGCCPTTVDNWEDWVSAGLYGCSDPESGGLSGKWCLKYEWNNLEYLIFKLNFECRVRSATQEWL